MTLTPRENPKAIIRNFEEFLNLRAAVYDASFFFKLRAEHPTEADDDAYYEQIDKIEDRIRQEAYKETREYVSHAYHTEDENKITAIMRRAGILFRGGRVYAAGPQHLEYEVF